MTRLTILRIALLPLFALLPYAKAQEPKPTEMVKTWTEGTIPPKATLDDVRWLQGEWEGKLEGAMQQATSFSPVSGHMPGFARAWGPDGAIWFYEINDFVEVGGSLEFRAKHFSSELAGWEEKNAFARHRLVAITDHALYFDGITFVREGSEHHTVYVRIAQGERQGAIVVVHQARTTRITY